MDPTFSPSRLREALAASDMTQEHLARELNVSLSTVSQWLGGKTDPKGKLLVRMAVTLNRPAGWFYPDHNDVAAA